MTLNLVIQRLACKPWESHAFCSLLCAKGGGLPLGKTEGLLAVPVQGKGDRGSGGRVVNSFGQSPTRQVGSPLYTKGPLMCLSFRALFTRRGNLVPFCLRLPQRVNTLRNDIHTLSFRASNASVGISI